MFDINALFDLKGFDERFDFLQNAGAKLVAQISRFDVLFAIEHYHVQLSGHFCSLTDVDHRETSVVLGFSSVDSRRMRQVVQNIVSVDRQTLTKEIEELVKTQIHKFDVAQEVRDFTSRHLRNERYDRKISEAADREAVAIAQTFVRQNFEITKK